MQSTGIQGFTERCAAARHADSALGGRVSKTELGRALSALREDDGAVDKAERAAARTYLISDEFMASSSRGARSLAHDFLAGRMPGTEEAYLGAMQEDFQQRFIAPSEDGRWVNLPPEAAVTDLATVPPDVREAVERNRPLPGRAAGAAAFRVAFEGTPVFAVHTHGDGMEQLSLFSASGKLLTWGSATPDGGYFWDD